MKHKGLFWGIMGVSLLVGGVLVVLGMTMGGQLGNASDLFGFNEKSDGNTVKVGGSSSNGQGTALESSQEICNLDFNLAAGDITITTGDEFSISGTKIYSEIRDDGKTWYLESPKRKWYHFLSNRVAGDWEITLPRGHQFESVNISFAAADLDVDYLCAKDLTIHGGAGDADIESLKVNESLDLKIAAGSLSIDKGEMEGDCRLDCGAGELDMEMSHMTGSLDANCGMGQIALELPGERGNYKIDSQASMGSIEIDGGREDDFHEGHNIWADLNLTCGMGQITVDFESD
ncbi:MAG: DUF4097 domain-containing protein [Lachnospiraceae bacterium]|nr:DUF4097 domain-containing protein [Lachnospiraceae bacterium]